MSNSPLHFNDFFKENFECLVRYAYFYVRDMQVAEDIVQDTFVWFLEQNGENQFTTSALAYFRTSIKNRSFNSLRDKNIHDKHHLLFLESIFENEVAEQQGLDQETIEEVRAAIQSLPTQMKKVFLLRYFHNLKYSEIAKQLNISPHTAKKQVQRGKQKLQKRLANISLFFL